MVCGGIYYCARAGTGSMLLYLGDAGSGLHGTRFASCGTRFLFLMGGPMCLNLSLSGSPNKFPFIFHVFAGF